LLATTTNSWDYRCEPVSLAKINYFYSSKDTIKKMKGERQRSGGLLFEAGPRKRMRPYLKNN
jgi:hypothetical protein